MVKTGVGKVSTNHILLILQFYDVSISTVEFSGKLTWSMENWVSILFEMGEIKSPGNLEGQSEQGGGLKGRNGRSEGLWAGDVSCRRWVRHRACMERDRHKGNLQMQGWERNAFRLSHATLLTWIPFPRQGQLNNFTYGRDGGPSAPACVLRVGLSFWSISNNPTYAGTRSPKCMWKPKRTTVCNAEKCCGC